MSGQTGQNLHLFKPQGSLDMQYLWREFGFCDEFVVDQAIQGNSSTLPGLAEQNSIQSSAQPGKIGLQILQASQQVCRRPALPADKIRLLSASP